MLLYEWVWGGCKFYASASENWLRGLDGIKATQTDIHTDREREREREKETNIELHQVGKKAIEEFDAKRKADMEKAQAKNRTDEKVRQIEFKKSNSNQEHTCACMHACMHTHTRMMCTH